MEQTTTVTSVTSSSDHFSSTRLTPPMCSRCQHCAVCNCRECQVKLCVEYCTTCRCYWRPTFCTVCGKHTGYTQTIYPSSYGCTKLTVPGCTPSCCPPTICPPACSCPPPPCPPPCPPPRPLPDCYRPPCPPPRPLPDCCRPPIRRIGCTQTCFTPPPPCPPPCPQPCPPPPCVSKTYCHICQKFV